MPTRRNISGLNRGYLHRRRREGRRQKAIRRLLIAADGGGVSGRQMMEAIYYRGEPWTEWRCATVRLSALRYAERVLEPRSRPLLWKAKPGLLN
jgi:hypothetical protein